ncbi:MAG: serine hydrolase [Saprospiraceae bacterium]
MKKIHNIIFISLLLPLLSISQNLDVQIEAIVNDYLATDAPGLAIMISQKENVRYEKAFGLSNTSNGIKTRLDDQFRIGSITKQFTAAAILKLAEEGQLHLENSINKFLPDITNDKEITIHHLLQHTSGLGNQSDIASFDQNSIDLNNYPENMMQDIFSSPLKFSPGSDYAYSNLGYVVLGQIIEQVSDMPYELYLKKSFFEPLGMKNTGFEYIDDHLAPKSSGYTKVNGKYEQAAFIPMKITYAAGGLVSNLRDLEKWNRSIMTGKVLPLNVVQQIQETNYLSEGNKTGYSYGWQIGNIQGLKTVKHDGIVNGFTSMAIYVPEFDVFVTTLSNCDCYRDIEILTSKITALSMGKPFPSHWVELTKKELQKFSGKYRRESSEMIITVHDNQLMYYQNKGQKRKLIPVDSNKLQIEGSLEQLEFSFAEGTNSYSLVSLNDITTWKKTESVIAYHSIVLDENKLEEYVGKYQVPNAFTFQVIRIGDTLYGQIGNDRKKMFCYDADKFCASKTDASLHFLRDQAGKIVKLSLSLDKDITAERI